MILFTNAATGAEVGRWTRDGGEIVATGAARSVLTAALRQDEDPWAFYSNWSNGYYVSHEISDESKALPRDGDGDGMIYDGTPRERPAPVRRPRIKKSSDLFPDVPYGEPPSDVDEAHDRLRAAFPNARVILPPMHADARSEMVLALERQARMFPEVAKTVQRIVKDVRNPGAMAAAGGDGSSYPHDPWLPNLFVGQVAQLSRAGWDGLTSSARESWAKQGVPFYSHVGEPEGGMRRVWEHEFGHLVQYHSIMQQRPKGPMTLAKLDPLRGRGTPYEWTPSLGKYGQTNGAELGAEIWLAGLLDGPLTPEQRKILESMIAAAKVPAADFEQSL